MGAFVVHGCQRFVLLLASSVPDVQLKLVSIPQVQNLFEERGPDCVLVAVRNFSLHVSLNNASFAHIH